MLRNRTIVEVVGCIVVGLIWAGVVFAQEAEYVGNTNCKVCHNKPAEGEQWNKWKAMAHANAFKILLEEKALAVAKEKGLEKPPSESPECLRCHVTAYDVETGEPPAKIKKEDGVQCESCHGPASLHLEDGKKLALRQDAAVDIKAHLIEATEQVCVKCHNAQSPTWNPERYTLEDGTKVGFDFEQASKKIAHPNPLKQKPEEQEAS